MKVSGKATLHAPAARVWTALGDPAVLARTIPGCERFEASGPDSYRMTFTAGIASTKGTYAGEISLSDRKEPTSFQMRATGAGSPGTVSTSVHIRLADAGDGSTQLTYDADAEVGGMIANVGQSMLSAVADRLASEFFAALNDVLTSEAAMAMTATQERRGAAGAAGVSFPAPATSEGASGMTGEPSTAPGQPAGRTAAGAPAELDAGAGPGLGAGAAANGALGSTGREPVRPGQVQVRGFLRGVLTGGVAALAGVAVTRLVSRRNPERNPRRNR